MYIEKLIKPVEDLRSYLVGLGISQIIPPLMAAFTASVGAFQVPLAYCVATACFVFATLSFGIFFFFQLSFQRSVVGKLVPVSPMIAVRRSEENGQKVVSGIKLGIQLNNIGIFPFEYNMETILSSVNGKMATDRIYTSRSALIYPGNPATYWDSEVPYHVQESELVDCRLKVSLRYGKPGDLKSQMTLGYRVASRVSVDAESSVDWQQDDQAFS